MAIDHLARRRVPFGPILIRPLGFAGGKPEHGIHARKRLISCRQEWGLGLVSQGWHPVRLRDHHRMANDLLDIQGKRPRIEEHRDILELIAAIDAPAAIRAEMDGAVVVVDGEHLIGSVGPALDVIEPDRVGGLPVTRVDQLLAAQFVAQVATDIGVEPVHGLAEELKLIIQRFSVRPDTPG